MSRFADEIGAKADVDARRWAFRGRAVGLAAGPEQPLVDKSGHSSVPWMSKIRPSDGCGKDAVPLAEERRYDFPEFGGYLGNDG